MKPLAQTVRFTRAPWHGAKHVCTTLGALLFAFGVLAQQPEAHTSSLNGIEMYYEISGSGPPLLLLHGFGGSGQDWNSMRGEYVNTYKVIVPDLRGHGRSTNPTNQFTHRQSALDVYALLDYLGIRQVRA